MDGLPVESRDKEARKFGRNDWVIKASAGDCDGNAFERCRSHTVIVDLDLVTNELRTCQSETLAETSVCLPLIVHRRCACSNCVPVGNRNVNPTCLKGTHSSRRSKRNDKTIRSACVSNSLI